jgi:site-specific DNA-cytosine methylase
VLSELNRIGYDVKYELLTSTDYNTPQKRQRVFFVCKHMESLDEFSFPNKEEFVNDWHNYLDEESNFKKVNKTPSRDKMRVKCKNITNEKWCNTITQKQDRWPNAGIIDYEDYYRFLTPKEQFRLMGFFNDEIKLPNLGKGALESLAGDGWDMNLVSKIFKEMFK